MANPPDDCAIEVTFDSGKEPPQFWLERIGSDGQYRSEIHFCDSDGSLKVRLPLGASAHRFAISFRLAPGDTSGGFAGIKIWPQGGSEPGEFSLPGRGVTETIPDTTLDLHAYFTDHGDPHKATLLSIGDSCSDPVEYCYCLGVYRNQDRQGPIDQDDPRIYNNWEPPQPLGCLRVLWQALFRR